MSQNSKESLISFINHYKKSIEKNAKNDERVLHCLQRLTKLRMDVDLLQNTGIGKTVANARKLDGEAGKLARKLLHKWKDIVAAHENSETKPESTSSSEPLFKLPIKLPPQANSPLSDAISKLSKDSDLGKHSKSSSHHHHSSTSSRSHHHHHHHHSSKEKEKEKDKMNNDNEKSSTSSSNKHHHKSSHHSNSSSHHNESSKRKRDEISTETSKEKSHKKSKVDEQHNNHKQEQLNNNKEEKSSSKKMKTEMKQAELDSSTGLGFAEALAMFDMPSSSKKKDLHLADKITTTITTSTTKSSSSKDSKKSSEKSSSSSSSSKSKIKELKATPKLLVEKPVKLEPLPDIVKELPTDISIPEYRPSPLSSAVKDYINSSQGSSSSSMFRQPQPKSMNEVQLMPDSFSKVINRTRVFSGNRVNKTMPTLFELCIRLLQENVNDIEETGGVPFDILKPVLERATPEQLERIEHHNPYLLEDSDCLWEPHIRRKFRARKREEMEAWREMFERCTREDEEKLSRLTKNIKKHQEIADSGVQKTRLAFVDSLVKPPRNVMRKQEIFGTNNKLVSSPAARTEGLKHLAPNLALPGDVRLRVAAGLRDDAQTYGRPSAKSIKKAPMMAKLISKWKR